MLSKTHSLTWLCLSCFLLPVALSAPTTISARECSQPSVRREWRKLSGEQKSAYHNAVKCIMGKPSSIDSGGQSKSVHDDFTFVHNQLQQQVHRVAVLFPWHRWFLEMHIEELKKCGFTDPMPYWDWTLDSGTAEKFLNSGIFDPVEGFGSIGTTQNCVEDGPYAGTQVNVPEPHCLKREFNSTLVDPMKWTKSEVKRIMEHPDYLNFWNETERTPHDFIHGATGGDMLQHWSPNDPLFHLHHAQIDRVWTQWQGRNKTRLSDYAGNTIQNVTDDTARLSDMMTMLGLASNINRTVEEFMDTQANGLCYIYEDDI